LKELKIESRRRTTITESCKIATGKAKIRDVKSNGAIKIIGKNIEVDFEDFVLSSGIADQSKYKGIGILVENSDDVVIRNAKISGYKYNIAVRNSKRVTLIDCDASRSYAKPLLSGDKYDKRDWLDIFKESIWRRYGAGIAIENSSFCRVEKCQSHNSVNGLWLVNSNDNYVIHNNFSHNSGWGIWMWKSCHNTVLFNNCDYCVRCERPGKYSKGGDSAGIMLSNANCHNLIAHNSLRHGGDGFFINGILGTPGSNDNVIAFNDGSHSPHNAFESTGSDRNQFIGNIASHSGYGFYLGGSTYNQVIGNIVENNMEWGVSFDTGYGNIIYGNKIKRAMAGVALCVYGDKKMPSRNNKVIGNTIEQCDSAVLLKKSSDCDINNNDVSNCKTAFEIIEKSHNCRITSNNITECKSVTVIDDSRDVICKDNFYEKKKAKGAFRKGVKL
jgi:parallel beta-helix repeat protein